MTIRELIKYKDMETYRKLQQIKYSSTSKKIKLGDSPKNLMKSNSYKRDKGAIKQTRWDK
ncbi:hypothetical protein J2Z76_000459 [Sedimentibacter acidaminivorans]|uniref:Uncharacterized protein n=1 Tax=Sedimentibacter acidaminivorans TaxID=913099 RepID=A0ABS4GAA5_9FIRM|nr:hypothetical protein [Sedimentibacter acidaminivorans]MBP1924606.1 hypothetical protein [Sedimentibacter acidaminivorans]